MKTRIRGHYLIKKRLQIGLALRVLLISIIFSLFIGFEIFITIWPVVSATIPKSLLDLVRHQILIRLLCFSLPVIFVIAAFSIAYSHRIAGPLYRIERTIDQLIQGEDVDFIRLRKDDELKKFAVKLNELIRIVKELKCSRA